MDKKLFYLSVFINVMTVISDAGTISHLNEIQAAKLISAVLERPVTSIDVMIYKEVKKPPKNIELIRKEVEQNLKEVEQNLKEAEQKFENLKKKGIIIEKIDLDNEVKKRFEEYNQPRLFKERIRIDGYLYRLDQTSIKSDIDVGPETDVHRTYVNCGNKEKDDYTHFLYDNKFKRAVIDNNKKTIWREHSVNEWIGIPTSVIDLLKRLGQSDSKSDGDSPILSVDSVQELIKGNLSGYKIEIKEIEDQDIDEIILTKSPQNKKILSINVSRKNYSRVYSYEIYNPVTGNLNYRRETKEFGEEGYPRQIHTITYNDLGEIIEEERVVVENVDLEPVLPGDLFQFNVPSGYTMIDDRLSPALILEPIDEMESIEPVKFLDESSLPKVIKAQTTGDKTSNDTDNISENKLTDDTERRIEQEKQNIDAGTDYRLYLLVITLLVGGFIFAFIYKHKRT